MSSVYKRPTPLSEVLASRITGQLVEWDAPVHRTSIRKNEHGEWHVKAFDANGKRLPNSDAFETDQKAAEETAAAMVKQHEKK